MVEIYSGVTFSDLTKEEFQKGILEDILKRESGKINSLAFHVFSKTGVEYGSIRINYSPKVIDLYPESHEFFREFKEYVKNRFPCFDVDPSPSNRKLIPNTVDKKAVLDLIDSFDNDGSKVLGFTMDYTFLTEQELLSLGLPQSKISHKQRVLDCL